MEVVIINKNDDIYTRELRTFKTKGIRYRLFILWSKIIKREYEIVDKKPIKKRKKKKKK